MNYKDEQIKRFRAMFNTDIVKYDNESPVIQFLLESMERAEREAVEKINDKNFEYMESCEPDCDEVRHAYHQGSWDHFWKLDKYIEEAFTQSGEKE